MADQASDLHVSRLRLVAAHDRLLAHTSATAAMADLEDMLLATQHIARLKEDLMLEAPFHELML